jgi:hypothetical protein
MKRKTSFEVSQEFRFGNSAPVSWATCRSRRANARISFTHRSRAHEKLSLRGFEKRSQ